MKSWFELILVGIRMDVCNGFVVEVYDFYVTFSLLTQVPCALFATKTQQALRAIYQDVYGRQIDKMIRGLSACS